MISIAVECLAPVCIVTGWHDRLAAFILAGFCVITAILFHRFWRYPQFWRFKEGEGLEHFWEFLEEFRIGGRTRPHHARASHLDVERVREPPIRIHARRRSSSRPAQRTDAMTHDQEAMPVRVAQRGDPLEKPGRRRMGLCRGGAARARAAARTARHDGAERSPIG